MAETVLHVGRKGTPKTCVAKPGNCPLAPGIVILKKLNKLKNLLIN